MEDKEDDWEDDESDEEEEEKKQYRMHCKTGTRYMSKRDVENILMYAVSIQHFHDQKCMRFN